MIAVPMLFFLYIGSGLAENEVAIVSPQNGDEVKSFVIVKGVANITDASFVWVLAHREDLENQWWPQDEPKVAGSEWKTVAYIGVERDIGHDFEIAVATFGKDAKKQ